MTKGMRHKDFYWLTKPQIAHDNICFHTNFIVSGVLLVCSTEIYTLLVNCLVLDKPIKLSFNRNNWKIHEKCYTV